LFVPSPTFAETAPFPTKMSMHEGTRNEACMCATRILRQARECTFVVVAAR
jgi:hypothetical protein